jgi:(2R)-sulfolactate sulfo-lyase subunit alpha
MADLGFLAHRRDDSVGVAVRDLDPGPADGGSLDGAPLGPVRVLDQVPLGHKLALRDIAAGDDVIEYGVRIGTASADIRTGQLVHVHNLRSARWQTSIA